LRVLSEIGVKGGADAAISDLRRMLDTPGSFVPYESVERTLESVTAD
jgi:hypothetical protein